MAGLASFGDAACTRSANSLETRMGVIGNLDDLVANAIECPRHQGLSFISMITSIFDVTQLPMVLFNLQLVVDGPDVV